MLSWFVAETMAEMRAYGNEQWDGDYPAQEHFAQDVAAQTLYVAVAEAAIVAKTTDSKPDVLESTGAKQAL